MRQRKKQKTSTQSVNKKKTSFLKSKGMPLFFRVIKRCAMPVAIILIILAIVISVFRALTPWARQYKGEVEQHLSLMLGQPVNISSMETSWYWFEPVIKLNQVIVSDAKDHVLQLNKLLVGIDLFSSLWHWHIQPGVLYVDDVHLILREANHAWHIDGLRQDKQQTVMTSDAYLPILTWLLSQQKIIIKHASAMVHLEDGAVFPLSGLHLTVVNYHGHYRLKGEVQLAQKTPTSLLVIADMTMKALALEQLNGRAYVSIKHVTPTQWQALFPDTAYQVEGGKGNLDVWFDVSKGRISTVQSVLDFDHLSWRKQGDQNAHWIDEIGANLAWHTTKDGWQLRADKVQLHIGNMRWLDNAFLIDHQPARHRDHLFLKWLSLEPLLSLDMPWPKQLNSVLRRHPKGQLYDTQVTVQDGQLQGVLTRFEELGWLQSKGGLGGEHFSGVFSWAPTEGRLEFDSKQMTLSSMDLPPFTLDALNAAFQWEQFGSDWRVTMERLTVNHPGFVLDAHGVVDDLLLTDSRRIELNAKFSADHAQSWLVYLPPNHLKAKLEHWLKQDIKQVGHLTGQVTVNGRWADFPFDKQPGIFSIETYLSGVDLYFNRKWPIIRDIRAFLTVNKRTLEADVIHALFQNVPLETANLRLDDMGLDKETLLIHGQVDVPGPALTHYVFSSPLQKPLSRLKNVALTGLVGLDLNLEVPLYPGNDEVLARGDLSFVKNNLTFHQNQHALSLEELSGDLQFNEHGVSDSTLATSLWNEPVSVHIQSIATPKPKTEIRLEGQTSLDALKRVNNLSLLSVMDGQFQWKALLALNNDIHEHDSFHLQTSLKGVQVALPQPFGKSFAESVPFDLRLDLGGESSLRLHMLYDHRFSGDVLFQSSTDGMRLDKGELRIGNGEAMADNRTGLWVVGEMDTLKVQAWKKLWAQWPSVTSDATVLPLVQGVDVHLGALEFLDKKYQNIGIKANKAPDNAWTVDIDQTDLAGQLHYQPMTNTLSGHLVRLHIPSTMFSKESSPRSWSTLKPKQIPQLLLEIDALQWGTIDVGHVALKSISTEAQWHLDNCTIHSPIYDLTLKGDWSVLEKQQKTLVEMDLKITDLAKTLDRFKIHPAVEAHQGHILWQGGWPGNIFEWSLPTLHGDMYMTFEEGRITELSPETEEKLGLGKLLSILSLQTIPRRLKLDFSDLSHAGYSFDVFKGNFTLEKGVMNTSDSYLDGPVAYASMKGDLDLVKQQYDMELHISPHITASLPVVATIAGGPIVGMAAWAVSKIINQGMQRVTGYTYKVTGPWLKPVVEQVKIYKK